MKIPRTFLESAPDFYRKQGEITRYRSALVRLRHYRAWIMYGFSHPVTARYRALMYKREKEARE